MGFIMLSGKVILSHGLHKNVIMNPGFGEVKLKSRVDHYKVMKKTGFVIEMMAPTCIFVE